MSPASISSSMEPHNGSANSNGRRSPRTNAGSSRSRRDGPTRRSRHRNHAHGNNVNGDGENHVGSHVNGATYDSAFSYAMSPTTEQSVGVPRVADYYGSQQYYASTQFYTNETTMYDNELQLDEEQPNTAASQNQQQIYPHILETGYYQPRTNVSNNYRNLPTSPTTARWSAEYSPEERLRLGIPRYATEEELEEQRRIYEQATQQADASEPAPHAG